MTEPKICRLCLIKSKNCIDIFGEKGNRLQIASILTQHFWFQVNEYDFSKNICISCWTDTQNFHEFYSKIENIQRNCQEIISTPIIDDVNESGRIKVEPEAAEDVKLLSQNKYYEQNDPTFEKIEIVEERLAIYTPEITDTIKIQNIKHSDDEDLDANSCDEDSFYNKSSSESSEDSTSEYKLKQKLRKKANNSEDIIKRSSESSEDSSDSSVIKSKLRKKPNKSEAKYKNGKKITKMQKDDALIRKFANMNCEMCDTKFQTYAKALLHYDHVHKINGYLTCCGEKWKKKRLILEHLKRHLNPNEYRCHPCDKLFVNKYELKKHTQNHGSLESKRYKCEKCPKSFTQESRFNAHMRKDHKIKKQNEECTCDICKQKFKSKFGLTNHIRTIHERSNMHVCEICSKVYKSRSGFVSHQLEHKEGPRSRLQCNICGAWLKDAHNLQTHIKRHTDGVQTCKICNKQLLHKHSLNTHMNIVHRERAHKCTLCDKAFKKARVLKEHMTTHTGEYIYKCSYCPKTFKFNPTLSLHHQKAHHAEWSQNRLKRFTPNQDPTNAE